MAGNGGTPAAGARRHDDALDGIRGFAVLLVYCAHAAGNAAHVALGLDVERVKFFDLTSVSERTLFWLYRSHHGVFLLFMLSGFLIGRLWWPRPTVGYATFAWRRTLRIYPAFLLAFAGSVVFAYTSGTWQRADLGALAANLLFLNGLPALHVNAFNPVTWSLFYEMTFYLAFPLLALPAFARGSRGAAALCAAGIAVPVAATLAGADALALCWSLLFCGVALAVHEPAWRAVAARLPAPTIVALYLAVTSLALVDALPAVPAILAFGAAAVLVVAKSLAPGNALGWLFSRPSLRAPGRVSYSFYLVHWMLVALVARAVARQAAASWWLAERPYFRWGHGRRRG